MTEASHRVSESRNLRRKTRTMNAITRFAPAPDHTPNAAPVHNVYTLTRGGQLAQILLDGKTYQLRITRAGKLILTK